MKLRYIGKSPKPLVWTGAFTKALYIFGGEVRCKMVDSRDAIAFEAGPFEMIGD